MLVKKVHNFPHQNTEVTDYPHEFVLRKYHCYKTVVNKYSQVNETTDFSYH